MIGSPASRIEAVLFDWGDTLFFSPRGETVLLEAAHEVGVRLESATASAIWAEIWAAGKTPTEHAKGRDLSADAHRSVWTSLFAAADEVVPGASAILYDRVMHPGGWLPYPDARPALVALRQRRLALGLVSNVGLDLRPVLRHHDMLGLFDTLALSYEHGAAKPAPSLFVAACEGLGVPRRNVRMVGDDPHTDGGAAAAGLQVHILRPLDRAPGNGRGLDEVVALVDRSRRAPGADSPDAAARE
ncbi:HAD-IA family hydrolase [soil metagenome]